MKNRFLPCPYCDGRGKFPKAELLRERRKTLGLTLRQMSERTGMSITYLSDIEHGKRNAKASITKEYGL